MRVLIADERPSVRAALRAVLEQDPQCEGIDEAVEARGVLAALGFGADLLIMEWGLPGLPPDILLMRARTGRPGIVVVALGRAIGARRAAEAAGVDCFIDTLEPPGDFVRLLHDLCPEAKKALRLMEQPT